MKNESKHNGILFTKDNVQLILSGAKTETRRLLAKDAEQAAWLRDADYEGLKVNHAKLFVFAGFRNEVRKEMMAIRMRYITGDVLFVKETFWHYGKWVKSVSRAGRPSYRFRAAKNKYSGNLHVLHQNPDWQDTVKGVTDKGTPIEATTKPYMVPKNKQALGFHKRPAIFMPKAAARLWIKVKNVTVHRLLGITDEQAIAEGMKTANSARLRYFELWNSIHKDCPALSDPWVVAVTFAAVPSPLR